MFDKMSIRTRVTAITVVLLTICCIGLTVLLNRSAYQMADTIMPLAGQIGYTWENPQPILPSIDAVNNGEEIIESKALTTVQAKNTYKIDSISYMICFIGFGGLLVYFIIDKALKPLNELSEQMKNKSIENLSKEIPLTNKKDEIYDLTMSFNKMTNTLNNSFLMQKRFSNNAAHELRTPLAVMRTNLDVFKKRKNPTVEEYNDLIERMRNQVIRLSDIVNSLLSLTNMEDIDLSQNIQLKSLLKSICNDLYFIAEQKKIKLLITGNEAAIKGNYNLVYRAFYNIIENAIKYNYENGSVDINIGKWKR